jgi:hypothetical protein
MPMLPQDPNAAAPAAPQMAAPDPNAAPATQMLPILAMLAQQQQAAVDQQNQQEAMMKEAMKQQILRLVSMMPTQNPAGVAARTEPLPTSMSANDAGMGGNMPTNNQSNYDVTGMDAGYGNAGA